MTIPAIKAGLFNVQGIRYHLEEIEDWIREEGLTLAVITETKLRPFTAILTDYTNINARMPVEEGGNAHGGITILLNNAYSHRVVLRIVNPTIQALGITIKDTTYVAIYIPKQVESQQLLHELTKIHMTCRGKTVLIGDFNARHKNWCSKGNRNGTCLKLWAEQNGWVIHAPPFPTRVGPRGAISTIDLVVTRNSNIHSFYYPRQCFGISDHLPVTFTIQQIIPPEPPPLQIPKSRRSRADLLDKLDKAMDENQARIEQLFRHADTLEELEAAYMEYVKLLTEPFIPKRQRRRRPRDKPWWTESLAHRVKHRDKLYRAWLRHGTPNTWTAYTRYQKRVKRAIRKAKQRHYKSFIEDLTADAQNNITQRVSRMLRNQRQRETTNIASTAGMLNLEEFTHTVATKFAPSPLVSGETFEPPPNFSQDITEAILQLAPKKAAGKDLVFNEALQHDVRANASIIMRLWEACGRLGTTPKIWNHILLYPLYKKDERHLAINYRPIALMSHIRKVVERAADINLRRETKFSHKQCGFKPNCGTENAILRFIYAANAGHNAVAVLDIKGAFPSVPRNKLMAYLKKRLGANLCSMISHFLTPDHIETIGDRNNIIRTVTTGVPEGGAISPSLFNLYIDTLAIELSQVSPAISQMVAIIYADDIMLLAKSAHGLQILLNMCSDWAARNLVHFAPSKSFVIIDQAPQQPFILSGEPLSIKEEVLYLGVLIDCFGVLPATIRRRARKMQARAQQLHRTVYMRRIHPLAMRKIFTTLLIPISDYGLHLVNYRAGNAADFHSAMYALEQIEWEALRPPLYLRTFRARRRVFAIYDLLSPKARRNLLASQTEVRLKLGLDHFLATNQPEEATLRKKELEALYSIYDYNTLQHPLQVHVKKGHKRERRIERKICIEKEKPHPAMRIKSHVIACALLRYHAKRFIDDAEIFRLNNKHGTETIDALRDEVRYLMQQPQLTDIQEKRLLEHVYTVTDSWVQRKDYRMENPWRNVNFNVLDQLRLPMHASEAPIPYYPN